MRRRLRHSTAAALLSAAALALAGCGGSSAADGEEQTSAATTTASSPAVQQLGPAEAQALIETGTAQVLDVRTPEEFAGGHVENAALIDFYAPDFEQRIAELDRDATYVVYCRSGNRSGQATALMAEKGFLSVNDVAGGILAWEAAGLPLVVPTP